MFHPASILLQLSFPGPRTLRKQRLELLLFFSTLNATPSTPTSENTESGTGTLRNKRLELLLFSSTVNAPMAHTRLSCGLAQDRKKFTPSTPTSENTRSFRAQTEV
ncbi:hypothetical protein C8J57DRAFT_1412782, partial [Mycena rebaudengoi]